MHLRCTHPSFLVSSFLTAVYAKCTIIERQILWQDLISIHNLVGATPWFLRGDFNAIATLGEAKGRVTPNLQSISDFHLSCPK